MIKVNIAWSISRLPHLANIELCFVTFKPVASRTTVFIKIAALLLVILYSSIYIWTTRSL